MKANSKTRNKNRHGVRPPNSKVGNTDRRTCNINGTKKKKREKKQRWERQRQDVRKLKDLRRHEKKEQCEATLQAKRQAKLAAIEEALRLDALHGIESKALKKQRDQLVEERRKAADAHRQSHGGAGKGAPLDEIARWRAMNKLLAVSQPRSATLPPAPPKAEPPFVAASRLDAGLHDTPSALQKDAKPPALTVGDAAPEDRPVPPPTPDSAVLAEKLSAAPTATPAPSETAAPAISASMASLITNAEKLHLFYLGHKPENAMPEHVEMLLEKYKGRLPLMMRSLRRRYGTAPDLMVS